VPSPFFDTRRYSGKREEEKERKEGREEKRRRPNGREGN
jgi:hypothetical protein